MRISLIFGNYVIRKLIALKLGQPIRTAAEVHRLAELHGGKQGTPTMGGVLIIGAVIISSALWARPDNRFVWLALFSMVYLGALGFADDYLKVTKKKSAGISGRYKLLFQMILAIIVTSVFLTSPLIDVQARSLYVPFIKAPVIANMSWFTFVFFALVIIGSSNAVNLTDGLDGLAIGCTVTVAFAYALLSYAAGNFRIAEYLQVPFYPFTGELTVVCAALVGAGLGFLWFNCHPAQVFMGDTGSLAIGGMHRRGSDLLQTRTAPRRRWRRLRHRSGLGHSCRSLSFKLDRATHLSPCRRIHHHFELVGWKENTVIVAVLDSLRDLRAARFGHAEVEMKNVRYKDQNVAVLGAGLSGTAAALLAQIGGRQRHRSRQRGGEKSAASRRSRICGPRAFA